METRIEVLVLGFYDRQNLGDESYKKAFVNLLGTQHNGVPLNISFKCTDDIDVLPSDVDIVICGGGDIINQYFMSKVQSLLEGFSGRAYAVSVGIPYPSAANYLHLFDHVFVRSQNDYQVAVQTVGEMNVSICGDISLLLLEGSGSIVKRTRQPRQVNIGICLAQPAFYNNLHKDKLLNDIVNGLVQVNSSLSDAEVQYHLLPFNQWSHSMSECDLYINQELEDLMVSRNLLCVKYAGEVVEPLDMLNMMASTMDAMICMRYHSVMFSVITGVPFAALYTTQKIYNILQDLGDVDNNMGCRMSCDGDSVPFAFDVNTFVASVLSSLDDNAHIKRVKLLAYKQQKLAGLASIAPLMLTEEKVKVAVCVTTTLSLDDVLTLCQHMLPMYLGIQADEVETLLTRRGTMQKYGKKRVDIARFICYIITQKTHHPTMWGLIENMRLPSFNLYEAIEYIWKDNQKSESTTGKVEYYAPSLHTFTTKKALVDVNNTFNKDFANVHRSGWTYVVNGLMILDGSQYMRGQGQVLIDTYVDRTFHWGLDTLMSLHIVPYKKPWIGFVHHTFDTTHSSYNCENLLNNSCFIESLANCKGLIALSKYLADELRLRLDAKGFTNVPVHNLCHPTEFVHESFMFTPQAFFNNPLKSVVQIGAWLRKPYAIYELNVHTSRKVALKGSEMDNYFAPPDYLSNMASVLLTPQDGNVAEGNTIMSRDIVCRDDSVNHFCSGVYGMLQTQYGTVYVCPKLSNVQYDELLSKNIVFLNLVDCSAVNTIIECIVRNTVVIVNRLPALEEVLGPQYPGFYSTLEEAAALCDSPSVIYDCYNHLNRMDKKRFTLEDFVNNMQKIVFGLVENVVVSDQVSFDEVLPGAFIQRFQFLARFFPKHLAAML